MCRLSQEIHNPAPQEANEKTINLAPPPRKSETSIKDSFNNINMKRIKKKLSFPSWPLPHSFSKGVFRCLNIAHSNSSWKDRVHLSDFYIIQVCFPQQLRGSQHSLFGIFIFIFITEQDHKVQLFIKSDVQKKKKNLSVNGGFATYQYNSLISITQLPYLTDLTTVIPLHNCPNNEMDSQYILTTI